MFTLASVTYFSSAFQSEAFPVMVSPVAHFRESCFLGHDIFGCIMHFEAPHVILMELGATLSLPIAEDENQSQEGLIAQTREGKHTWMTEPGDRKMNP